jgi:hypothetical protein
MVPRKNNRPKIALQAALLRNTYPGCHVKTSLNLSLIWNFKIRPSPLSDEYRVKMDYTTGKQPKIFVKTKLILADGAAELPHVYDQERQRLCLFFPDGSQWNSTMLLAKTVVPWIYDWLFHYELWLVTGIWHGGGIHPESEDAKLRDEELSAVSGPG